MRESVGERQNETSRRTTRQGGKRLVRRLTRPFIDEALHHLGKVLDITIEWRQVALLTAFIEWSNGEVPS